MKRPTHVLYTTGLIVYEYLQSNNISEGSIYTTKKDKELKKEIFRLPQY